MAAWLALLGGHAALVHRLDQELHEALGISLQWYEVLLRLYRAPGRRLRMQELGESLYFSPSGVTRVTDRLCEAGLVRREKCALDRRGTYAALTDEGVELFRQAGPVHLRGIQEHFGRHLDDEEAEVIASAMSRVGS
jgi:DNA-binding MarR family transcriptional regulator